MFFYVLAREFPVIYYQRGESCQYIPCGIVIILCFSDTGPVAHTIGVLHSIEMYSWSAAFLVQRNMTDLYIMVRIFPSGVSNQDHALAPPALSPPWPDPAGTVPQRNPRSVTPHSHILFRQFLAFLVQDSAGDTYQRRNGQYGATPDSQRRAPPALEGDRIQCHSWYG